MNQQLRPKSAVDIVTAAERLGVHPMTVRRYIADGRLPAHRVGPKLIRINADDLERFASGNVA
jgi:excisionase family DNA binding protein